MRSRILGRLHILPVQAEGPIWSEIQILKLRLALPQ